MTRYPKPFAHLDEEVVDANGEHFAFADSVEAAAEIVALANAAHRARQAHERYMARAIRKEPVL